MMEISKRKKIIISTVFVLLFAAAIHISAESVWEGSAAMGRYGEFPFTGYYGASNSFPQNAFVEVENLENGKRTRLIVVDRLSDSGLLMLVSNEAAQELGIYQNDIARIKVRMLTRSTGVETPLYNDSAYSSDPDLNPAAALMSPAELIGQDLSDSRTDVNPAAKPEPEPKVAVVPEPELEPEAEFPVFTEMPPRTDGLSEAEILVAEQEVPSDIAADTPEKPFDWPETIRTEPEQVKTPEPLYLAMDDLEEGQPIEESNSPARGMHSPDTDPIWPDGAEESEVLTTNAENDTRVDVNGLVDASPLNPSDGIGGTGLQLPEASLELLSSGLGNAEPSYSEAESFNLSSLPEIVEKVSDEKSEYITEASDYHSPEISEADVSSSGLPVPEPEIPEEVIAVLVGDHLLISENEPEKIEVDSSYIDVPEIVYSGEGSSAILTVDLMDAYPVDSDDAGLVATAMPLLPGADDSILVEVSNGYIIPGRDDYTGEVKDFPDYAGAPVPAEVPTADDELAFPDTPDEGEDVVLPEMTVVPEVVKGEGENTENEEIAEAVPEYNENLEISLVPAEVKPPELFEEETALVESEPESTEPVVEQIVVADAEATAETAPVERTVEPELTAPAQVAMVSKLQQQKHYLQLGAFKEKNSAIKAAGKLEAVYPVTILTDEETASYKLLLGPLSADESGIMLYNFRAGGYSDAFIRRIE